MKGIADTGFVVAFANRRDRFHDWAVSVASQISAPLLTCDAVLAEAAFHLGDARVVLEFVVRGLLSPSIVIAEHVSRLCDLAHRFKDRKPDLADLCLIRLSELHPHLPVITIDNQDFRVYRRNRNEAIPLILPPNI